MNNKQSNPSFVTTNNGEKQAHSWLLQRSNILGLQGSQYGFSLTDPISRKGWVSPQPLVNLESFSPNCSPGLTPLKCSTCSLKWDGSPMVTGLISIKSQRGGHSTPLFYAKGRILKIQS